jgi:hypothetical protein
MTASPQIRVPHLRDGFIVAKVGIAHLRDRSDCAFKNGALAPEGKLV